MLAASVDWQKLLNTVPVDSTPPGALNMCCQSIKLGLEHCGFSCYSEEFLEDAELWETKEIYDLSEFLLTQLSLTSLIIKGIWWCDCTWLRHLSTVLDCVDPKGCTCLWKLKLPDRKLYLGHIFYIYPMQMSKRLEEIICCLVICWVWKGTYHF